MIKTFWITTVLTVLLMLFTVPVMAGISNNWNNWSETDSKFQWTSTFFICFDMYQTDLAIKNGAKEVGYASYFIGNYPTTQQIIEYGILTSLVNYGVSRIMPIKYRRIFQIGTIISEYDCISRSYGTKLVIRFLINQ